jgi:hypothetical protein
MPFEITHSRRVGTTLSIDLDNDGRTVIDIQDSAHILTFALSDRELRALIRELQEHLPHARDGR